MAIESIYKLEDYDEYFLWLCALVNADMDRYSELLWELHDTDFVWILDIDASRAVDGLELRKTYYALTGEDWIEFWEHNCTVLEMLVALAQRMEGSMGDVNTGDRTRVWFWEMIRNLGLKPFDNTHLMYGGYIREDGVCRMINTDEELMNVKIILVNWMNRDFDIYGNGSPFPLRYPAYDQRERSIVYQMYDYICENYPE